MNGRQREFKAIVWPEGDRPIERVRILAETHADAVELLRDTYGPECQFDLTDVEAASRPRDPSAPVGLPTVERLEPAPAQAAFFEIMAASARRIVAHSGPVYWLGIRLMGDLTPVLTEADYAGAAYEIWGGLTDAIDGPSPYARGLSEGQVENLMRRAASEWLALDLSDSAMERYFERWRTWPESVREDTGQVLTPPGHDGWPARSEVEAAWRAVISGEKSREDVHDWSVPWVEGSKAVGPPLDLMVGTGLQFLHGLDMISLPQSPNLIGHGTQGRYALTDAEVAARLDHWLRMCADYDQDPDGFRLRARARRDT